ncbi:hypothetical protein TVAG_121790 [Trichomonas vaginalis G3]|uniref:Eukaryotic initiation factor 4E family protein n=1 Tax=Trichomonas vaginalis (strain ATCC PRA-98 / G3) TaxID=412133 RepID=A2E990_TRIV3|nr:translation initiation factor protein [Trichomonas vaginalis G3]EAY10775.1 hypothetical protein TVAG_121790 [Trichomonas vaginalis G3]KAI5536087.1 translation initiation factor protein [Trichomonas vaginalis G3]|eukprot:XP_001322998.1 hypothetical protein [Trichomonas vaginalis G3]
MTVAHPLPTEWQFWVIQIKWEGKNRNFEIEPIVGFKTVEDFWNNFMQFPPIGEIKKGGISLFKKGIKPAWEDPKNENGQAVTISLSVWTQELWEKIILAIVGGSIDDVIKEPELCGMYAKVNQIGLSVALWFGPGELNVNALAEVLSLDPAVLQVKAHPKN